MKSQKTFIGTEVRYTNIGTLRQTRLHYVVAKGSAADGISMGEAEIIYFFYLSSEFFDEVQNKWSKIVE